MPTARLALLAGFVCATLPATRAADPKPVELRPAWKKGDKVKYEVVKTQVREAEGKAARKSGARTPVELEVIEAGAKGYVVRWTQGETTFDDPKVAEQPLAKAVAGLANGMVMELEVDPDGTFSGVRNWKEVQALARKTTETLFAEVAKAGLPKATVDALRAEVEKTYATREAVAVSFTRETELLFCALGVTYDPTKPVRADVTLPNPLGGDPIPAVTEFALKKWDAATGAATVTLRTRPDPKELTKVLDKTMRDLAKKLGKPVDGATPLPTVELEDDAEITVDAKTGWVRAATWTRRVKAGPSARTETTTLTRRGE